MNETAIKSLKSPAPLHSGSRVAIVSPASKINPQYVADAAEALRCERFTTIIAPHATGDSGSYSATADERTADMQQALTDETIEGIICSRGGYGAIHLLDSLNRLSDQCFDKWLVGFSDVTALHCLWQIKGYASLHAAMTKHIGRMEDFAGFRKEMDALCGSELNYTFEGDSRNMHGVAEGVVTGGNLAVFGGLIGTPYDPFEALFTAENIRNGVAPRPILFIEDIAEPIYKVERILWQLRMRGVFNVVSGVMVGQFTEYRSGIDHPDMETMISRFFENMARETGRRCPVAFNLPMGHIEGNMPLLLGRPTTLSVTPDGVNIEQR